METKIFVVSDWRWTRCPVNCQQYQDENKCSHQRPFPIPHNVVVKINNNTILSVSCHQGRKPGGPICQYDEPQKRCNHCKMAEKHALGGGEVDDPIETSIILKESVSVPKCPNCHQKWGVVALIDDKFSCRNPVCIREDNRGRSHKFVFVRGETQKLPPKRSEWAINNRVR